jgi:hypothetical protein
MIKTQNIDNNFNVEKIKNFFKNLKFYEVVDFIFFNFAVFLILFAWTRFLTKNIVSAIAISVIILLVANFVKTVLKKSSATKKKKVNAKTAEVENAFVNIFASSEEENAQLFLNIFNHFRESKLKENDIIFDDKVVCFDFDERVAPIEKALKKILIATKLGQKKIMFLCYSFDAKDKIFVENLKDFEVKVVQKDEIYEKLFVPSQIFPKKSVEVKAGGKIKFKQLVKMSFGREKAKKYFLSGLLVFFCSLIVKNNLFYVFMSSIMFCFALFSLSKKEEATNFFD